MTTDPTQVTHKIDPNQREDLRAVYLAIHASAITTDIPEVAAELKLKRQYVKELVGVLETHSDRDGNAFVVVNAEPGESGNDSAHVWYQTFYTWDSRTVDEMEHWFDLHFPALVDPEHVKAIKDMVPAPQTPQNATNPADLPLCRCGCKVPVNARNRNYLPGHDARHAGQVGKAIAEQDPDSDKRETMLAVLPTDALRRKASDIADRRLQKAAAKTQSTRSQQRKAGKSEAEIEKVQDIDGTVKVGRYELRAVQNSKSGAVVYFTKDDKANVASERIAKTFKVAQ